MINAFTSYKNIFNEMYNVNVRLTSYVLYIFIKENINKVNTNCMYLNLYIHT